MIVAQFIEISRALYYNDRDCIRGEFMILLLGMVRIILYIILTYIIMNSNSKIIIMAIVKLVIMMVHSTAVKTIAYPDEVVQCNTVIEEVTTVINQALLKHPV